MKLPYRNNCFVPKEKLTKYLLNPRHARGKDKARFFTRMGFNEEEYELLEKELISLARKNEVMKIRDSESQMKYDIKGIIKTPTGREVSITTVWAIDRGKRKPRFITAYPLERKKFGKSV